MSEVISFRLNPDNPREAQALEILRTKQAEGFSSRRVLTDALVDLAARKEQDTLFSIEEFNMALEHVSDLLERIDGGSQGNENHQSTSPQRVTLHDDFLNSVKVAAKPGLNLD
ncbi:MAG: hypothetical protein ISR58_07080 [Anaerolineales bacterium]|nr:hypothetical protein [Chloroflexota bacterium]MBL6980938.1 hypothetical protein [Anaerolineales bacterium]